MSSLSIFIATRPGEINRVYQDKLVGRDPKRSKGRAVDDDTPTPADLTKSDRRLIERVQVFSHFQAGFVDHNQEVDTTSVAEAKSSGDQVEPSNDQLENTQVEDATPDVNDSTESSNSYYSGDEADNQLQMVVYQGLVYSTPLAQEDEELSRPVEVNGAPSSPSESAEIPRSDLQMVVSNNQTLPSPRDDETPKIEDELNPTPAAQVDLPLEEEINLRPSRSSTRGENRDTLPASLPSESTVEIRRKPPLLLLNACWPSSPKGEGGAAPPTLLPVAAVLTDDGNEKARDNRSHIKGMRKVIRRTKKVVDEMKACVTKDTSSAKTFIETQTPSTSRGTIFEKEVLKALKNTEMMMDFIMEGMSNLHAGKDKIQKE
nr:hypothetical protein Iba_chr04fCG15240 [Ipomoea batatas]